MNFFAGPDPDKAVTAAHALFFANETSDDPWRSGLEDIPEADIATSAASFYEQE